MDEQDERIQGWEQISEHPFFRAAYNNNGPLINSMIKMLDEARAGRSEVMAEQAEEPVEWRILKAFTNGYSEGMHRASAGRLDH